MEVVLLLPPTNSFGLSTNRVELLQGKGAPIEQKEKNLHFHFCKQEENQQQAESPHFDSLAGKRRPKRATELVGKIDNVFYTLHITNVTQYT